MDEVTITSERYRKYQDAEAKLARAVEVLKKWVDYDALLLSLPGEGPLYGDEIREVDAAYDACIDATAAAIDEAEGRSDAD